MSEWQEEQSENTAHNNEFSNTLIHFQKASNSNNIGNYLHPQ